MRQIVVFSLGGLRCGLDITRVQEIIRMPELTPAGGTAAAVAGIINLRGQILTVLDLRTVLSLSAAEAGGERKIIIVKDREGFIGFCCDDVHDILTMKERFVESKVPRLKGVDVTYFSGIYKTEDMLILLLDPERVLEEDGGGQ